MFCPMCGQLVAQGSRFCSRCGARLSTSFAPSLGAPAASATASAFNTRRAVVIVGLVAAVAVITFVVQSREADSSNSTPARSLTPHKPAAHDSEDSKPVTTEKAAPVQTSLPKPSVPPPKFRIYRSDPLAGTSIVVPSNTTDEQLKSLLWLFREKVRSRHFTEIGITQPTSENWGKKNYLEGMLSVYRGEKCANEAFIASVGPCGYGEHDDAFYQWGFRGDDGAFDPNHDAASIRLADGREVKVFDYKDKE